MITSMFADSVGDEDKKPLFVECLACKHSWIGLYMPMSLERVIEIMKGLHCPNCGADSNSIFKKKEKDI